jgi:hypothetical protein
MNVQVKELIHTVDECQRNCEWRVLNVFFRWSDFQIIKSERKMI